jgi:hypothetical protein
MTTGHLNTKFQENICAHLTLSEKMLVNVGQYGVSSCVLAIEFMYLRLNYKL